MTTLGGIMIKIGLREANQYFSKYIDMVREGKEIVLTDRGKPVAIIEPVIKNKLAESRVRLLEKQGILRSSVKGRFPFHKLLSIRGQPVSETVIEGREDRVK